MEAASAGLRSASLTGQALRRPAKALMALQSELGTPTIHLVKAFTLNGLEAKQYSFLIYPAQSVITDLVTTKSGETFDLSYPSYDATNTPMIDHMLASFRSQNQPR